jgi:hypothetical protein
LRINEDVPLAPVDFFFRDRSLCVRHEREQS